MRTIPERRHPHPHIDPRQPRDRSEPATNPPVFAWLPGEGMARFELQVSKRADFATTVLNVGDLSEPVFLPEKRLAPGTYHWRWGCAGVFAPALTFVIKSSATVLEVPAVETWLARFSSRHPRIYACPEDLTALRARGRGAHASLIARADALLRESHELKEPPFLPDWNTEYEKTFSLWYDIVMRSRRFAKGGEILGLAYLATGERAYARAACRRMVSLSRWNPDGSSHLSHNDEAHMAVIWHGPFACDWIWNEFTEPERRQVIDHFRKRGRQTFGHMHGDGSYGVTRFDSHAGREIVFLAMIALVFHDEIPEARQWLAWLRPVLCGIWPIWGGEDGGWAEGHSYGSAYVGIMTMFASALKRGAGIDLYRRPFWRNHAAWRRATLPVYAEMVAFGDSSERAPGKWLELADLVELIGRETGTAEFDRYVKSLREAAFTMQAAPKRREQVAASVLYLAPRERPRRTARSGKSGAMLHVFADVGSAAIRTHADDESRDIAFLFRSSPYGSISHAHANNNDFVLHVAGRALLIPSGYYDGYASDHHANWVWHSKSHNCLTLSDASQRLRSHDSVGSVDSAFEDERIVYFLGTADASYGPAVKHCRRHVLFIKRSRTFVLVDDVAMQDGHPIAAQWNAHSWNRFSFDAEQRTFSLKRGASLVRGHFLFHENAFFSPGRGWDPPPKPKNALMEQWQMQYHLRFTASALKTRRTLGVVLCPGHASLRCAKVETEKVGSTEVAHIGNDLVLVGQSGPIVYRRNRSDGVVLAVVDGRRYDISRDGLSR